MYAVETYTGREVWRGSREECLAWLAEHWAFVLYFRVVRLSDGAILA